MKFTWDEEHKIMYFYFDHSGKEGSVKKTVVDYWPGVNVDIGWDGKPLGLEIVYAERIED